MHRLHYLVIGLNEILFSDQVTIQYEHLVLEFVACFLYLFDFLTLVIDLLTGFYQVVIKMLSV